MKILLDECLPADFRRSFPGREAHSVEWAGLKGKKNGELPQAAERGGYQVLLTVDQGIPHQQTMVGRLTLDHSDPISNQPDGRSIAPGPQDYQGIGVHSARSECPSSAHWLSLAPLGQKMYKRRKYVPAEARVRFAKSDVLIRARR